MFPKIALTLPVLSAIAAGVSGAAIRTRGSGVNPADFSSEGLVAIGQFSASARDKNGETIGGIGSAGGLVPGKFSRNGDTYSGQLYLQPDRGYNVEDTINYVARHHLFDFSFAEYTGSANLTFDQAIKLFNITYRDTTFYHEASGKNTTGLDPTIVRTGGLSGSGSNDGPLAAANAPNNPGALSFDTEGFSANPDGTFWVSDEYTPGIYKTAADGTIIAYITPPEAVLPRIGGKYNFTSKATPDSGRAPNAGFEGMAVSWDGNQLFAVLQSALVQDGGDGASYLRIFEWDISSLSGVTTYQGGANPGDNIPLIAEYAYKVPTSSKGKARNVNDLIYLGHKTVGILVRDGNGFGSDDSGVKYKHIDILDLSTGTNINGTKYNTATGSIAPGGKLSSGINLASYSSLVDYITDLGKFGMHGSGEPVDPTLIAAKIESLILLPTLPKSSSDSSFDKDEYYILSFSDNDFQTKDGYMRAIGAYSAAYPQDVPTQAFVFKVKLPGVNRGDMLSRLGLS
ncbi:Multicopper oxidase, laccase [Pseudozyma hubeiensis]|nr:Multicopper oxidase, laccase [Pseudozyma hubeiensis]